MPLIVLQNRFLAVLHLSGALTPALRRALCVISRSPLVEKDVRSYSAETVVSLALIQRKIHDAYEVEAEADLESQGNMSAAIDWARSLEGIAAALSLCLGRNVEAVTDPPGSVSVPPFSIADAGDSSQYTALSSKMDDSRPASAEDFAATGWGWKLELLCQGDIKVFNGTLCLFLLSASSIARVLPLSAGFSKEIWNVVESVTVQLESDGNQGRKSAEWSLPSSREASFIIALFRFACSLCPSKHYGPSFSSHLVDSVTALVLQDDLEINPLIEYLMFEDSRSITLLWFENASTLLQSRLHQVTSGQEMLPSLPENQGVVSSHSCWELKILTLLRALVRMFNSQRLVLWWRGHNSSSPMLSALFKVYVAARCLGSEFPDLYDAPIVASLMSGSGLLTAFEATNNCEEQADLLLSV